MGVEPGIPAMMRGAPAGPAPVAALLHPAKFDRALMGAWSELARHSAEPNPFLHPWFLLPSLTHLADGADIRVAVVTAGRRLLGLVPLCVGQRYGRMSIRHVRNWVHGQSFLGTPLVRKGHETEVAAALIGLLDGSDWARGFLHLTHIAEGGPVHCGLMEASAARGRPCAIVHRRQRALLESGADPETYIERAIRGKKRKEFRRQANRLAELGAVSFRTLDAGDDPAAWCADFLALESAGWKGDEGGEALAKSDATRRFFEEIVLGAAHAGALEMLRLDLDGRAIAMMVTFVTPPGAYSYKIAYDEEYARFSPGVLIELDNISRAFADDRIAWTDSCAMEGHPMIERLWTERRAIVHVSLPLSGALRRSQFAVCRAAETTSAGLRNLLADRKGSA